MDGRSKMPGTRRDAATQSTLNHRSRFSLYMIGVSAALLMGGARPAFAQAMGKASVEHASSAPRGVNARVETPPPSILPSGVFSSASSSSTSSPIATATPASTLPSMASSTLAPSATASVPPSTISPPSASLDPSSAVTPASTSSTAPAAASGQGSASLSSSASPSVAAAAPSNVIEKVAAEAPGTAAGGVKEGKITEGEGHGKLAAGSQESPARSIESMPIRGGLPEKGGTTSGHERNGLWNGFSSVAQVAGALGVVLGLVYVGRTLVRKFVPGASAGNGKGVLEILARYPLAKTQSLVLVRIGSQIVVLNQGKEMSRSVLVISDPTEVANLLGQIQGSKPNSIQAGFSHLLTDARRELERSPATEREAEPEGLPAANRPMSVEADLDSELDEMAAARRQLMELRDQVRSVRERLVK